MSDDVYRPTPTQAEADRAAQGDSPTVHLPDGSQEIPHAAPQAKPAPPSDEPELNFRTRALEPERPSTYRTRAQRRADSEAAGEHSGESDEER